MKLAFILLASLLCLPQVQQKQSPPESGPAKTLEKEIKRSDWYPKSQRQHIQQLRGAIYTGLQASQSRDSDASWVMYSLAMKQANSAGDLTLSHRYARMIEDKWEMPDEFLLKWHADAIKRAKNEAQVVELARLFREDIEKLSPTGSIKNWEKAYKKVRRAGEKSRSEFTKLACQKVFMETDVWFEIVKGVRLQDTTAIGFGDILSGKIDVGIERLSQSKNNDLAATAKLVRQTNAKFSGAHERLLRILSDSKSSTAKLAAQKIFKSMVSDLNEEQIGICQRICFGMTEPLPLKGDFALPFYGVPFGYLGATNAKLDDLAYDGESARWLCGSNASISWPHTPFENYVQEVDLTITAMGQRIQLIHGGEDSGVIRFEKSDDSVRARLLHRIGSGYNWKGSRSFKEGEKLTIKIYRTPERMFAFINGRQLGSRHVGLGWNPIRFSVGGNSQAVVSRVMTRPWLPGDREVLKKIAGDNEAIEMTIVDANLPSIEQYSKFVQSCGDAETKPAKGKSFLMPMDIVMRPVAAGMFEREGDSRKVLISNDFYCSAHEITQLQFGNLMGYNPSSIQGNPYLPVDNVSLTEATRFCEELSKSMSKKGMIPPGYAYRLPTEAEWTFAAMDDGKNDMDVPESKTWNWTTAKGGFQMVGTSSPNKRGIYDMHGNVEEITADRFNKRDANSKDKNDIVDPRHAPGENGPIVVKGGSWNVGANQTGAKQRDRRDRTGTPGRGFRIVLAPRFN